MNHLEAVQLADYVRGLGSPLSRKAVEEHLSSGCPKCRKAVQALSRVVNGSRAETGYSVPEHTVRRVKAIYDLRPPEGVSFHPRMAARLIYDSFKAPIPSGIRTGQDFARHILYSAADYALDLRLQQSHRPGAIALIGQLTDRRTPDRMMAGLSVFLTRGKNVVAGTKSNAFGEFQIEYQPSRRLRLHLQIHENLKDGVSCATDRIEIEQESGLRAVRRIGNGTKC